MALKTMAELKSYVKDKLDLRDEDFITDTEMTSYIEEAIGYCEAEIHKLNIEDQYFVAQSTIALVSGQSDYDLPSNIYGNKILRLVYTYNNDIYNVRRITQSDRYAQSELIRQYSVGNPATYGYMLLNLDPRLGTRMRLFPTPTESSAIVTASGTSTSGSAVLTGLASTTGVAVNDFVSGTGIVTGTRVKSVDSASQITMCENAVATGTVTFTFTQPRLVIWYIRNASVPTASTDYIDFPEFWHFVAQHVVVNCLKKEVGNPRIQIEVQTLLKVEQQMLETLSNMVPDQDDKIEQDLTSYEEGNY